MPFKANSHGAPKLQTLDHDQTYCYYSSYEKEAKTKELLACLRVVAQYSQADIDERRPGNVPLGRQISVALNTSPPCLVEALLGTLP